MNYVAAITLIALTILGEARSQPADGQRCLAHTIVNRMAISDWSAEEVIFQPHQYHVWDSGVLAEGNGLKLRWLICEAWEQFPENPWCMEPVLAIGSAEEWERVYVLAESVYRGGAPPEGCERVLNYDNLDKFWGGADPPWAVDMDLAACIGDHCFYRKPIEEATHADLRIRMRKLRAPL